MYFSSIHVQRTKIMALLVFKSIFFHNRLSLRLFNQQNKNLKDHDYDWQKRFKLK